MIENIPKMETLAKVFHVLQSCNFLDFLDLFFLSFIGYIE